MKKNGEKEEVEIYLFIFLWNWGNKQTCSYFGVVLILKNIEKYYT